jgi:LPXTG-site transpeptidase (sortase) family protein
MDTRAVQRAAAHVLLGAGAAGLLLYGASQAWALYYERRESARLDMAREEPVDGSSRAAALRRSVGGGAWGRLEIERLKVSALIAEGTDARTLAVALGHIGGSAFPGESGTVALAGHRDSHLRGLARVRIGDRVRIVTPEAGFDYEVEATFVVPPERVDLIQPGPGPRLALVTCYPFGYVGPAPYRLVVQARPMPARAGSPGKISRAPGTTKG